MKIERDPNLVLDAAVIDAVRAMNADPITNDPPSLVYIAKRVWASCAATRESLLRLEAEGRIKRRWNGGGWEVVR